LPQPDPYSPQKQWDPPLHMERQWGPHGKAGPPRARGRSGLSVPAASPPPDERSARRERAIAIQLRDALAALQRSHVGGGRAAAHAVLGSLSNRTVIAQPAVGSVAGDSSGPDDDGPLIAQTWLWSCSVGVLISCSCCITPLVDPESFGFNAFVDVVIILNVLLVLVQLLVSSPIIGFLEEWFTVIFVAEVAIRMRVEKREWFTFWNIFDFFLALSAVVQAWVVPCIDYYDETSELDSGTAWVYISTALRALRLFRLARLLRPSGTFAVKKVTIEENDETEVWLTLPKDEGGKKKSGGKAGAPTAP